MTANKFFRKYLPLGLAVALALLGGVSYLANPKQASASVTLLTHNSYGAPGGGDATAVASIDSTGATLLVAVTSNYGVRGLPTVTDSNGNTWHQLTAQLQDGSGSSYGVISYAYDKSGSALVTSATNTVTVNTGGGGFVAVSFMAFSGTLTGADPFDVQNGTPSSGVRTTSRSTGSITPSQNNELVIAGYVAENTDSSNTIDSGYTTIDIVPVVNSAHFGVSSAYLVQSTAAATNPTWSDPNNQFIAAVIASFKSSSAGGGGSPAPKHQVIIISLLPIKQP